MTDDIDPEILYAAALGATLARMRAELDVAAIKRVLVFTLGRWGVSATIGNIERLPPARVVEKPEPQVVDLARPYIPENEPPSIRIPIHNATCPICGKTAINNISLNTHMHKSHGTTLKEHRRTLALDTEANVKQGETQP